MKKFVKMMAAVLAMLTLMTACGKSEEEQALDEIRSHIYEEAAADGVDLDALLESEYAASQERVEQFDQEQAKKQDLAAQVDALMPQIAAVCETYNSASTPAEIIAAAEEFNKLHESCIALAGTNTGYKSLVANKLWENTGRRNRIEEAVYLGKAALTGANISSDYTDVYFYFQPETNDSKFLCTRQNEAHEQEILVLSQNGDIYIPDLSAIKAMDPSTYYAYNLTEDSLIVEVIVNADWRKFEFLLNDPASTGTEIDFTQPDTEYTIWNLWAPTLDEFNTKESMESFYEHAKF